MHGSQRTQQHFLKNGLPAFGPRCKQNFSGKLLPEFNDGLAGIGLAVIYRQRGYRCCPEIPYGGREIFRLFRPDPEVFEPG